MGTGGTRSHRCITTKKRRKKPYLVAIVTLWNANHGHSRSPKDLALEHTLTCNNVRNIFRENSPADIAKRVST